MKWSTIWELIKINILYSNPQNMSQIKKKREKSPEKQIVAYKSMLRQQGLLMLLFTFVYLFNFIMVDFAKLPGYFTQYVMLFFLMAVFNAFSAMYAIFYDSKDLDLYAPLPIKTSDLYLAKVFSSLGMGAVFLMPLLSLFILLAFRVGGILMVPLGLLFFLLALVSCLTLALSVNHLVGGLVVRSSRRKLFSTILMVLTTLGIMGSLFYFLAANNKIAMADGHLVDRPLIPYFRGYYDVLVHPLAFETLLNFYLPLVLILILALLLVKYFIPRYYQEAFYKSQEQEAKSQKQKVYKNTGLNRTLIRHHLATLQNGTLIVQSLMTPILFPVMIVFYSLSIDKSIVAQFSGAYFGFAWLVGLAFGGLSATPASFPAVGLSLEKENYLAFKALPINFKDFLKQKYLVLVSLQIFLPWLVSIAIGFYFGLQFLLILALALGYLLSAFVLNEFMYRRDYRNLVLNWQDMTQLFNRGGGQWVAFAFLLLIFLCGGLIFGLTVLLTVLLGALATSCLVLVISLLVFAFLQYRLDRTFWKVLD
ncbi:hypothetical protein ACVR0A_04220 [Streptococcus downei]|uniref:ABC transporter permease n=1 Tax=Streptococcus downei MFe28 TaxID=764290 RepID=A0A380JE56_STRDO|nr:hypothetical protein [Streptococcus downei]SUN35687.1 ABC transporter permease [Streptococcus downei MFe28]